MFNAQDIILARQFKPDLSISKLDTESLILLKIMNHARGGGVVPVYDADITNGIASFDGVTRSKPLVSLKLNLPVTQTGSGTPSPDNKRNFIGFSGVNVSRTGKNLWGGLTMAEAFDGKVTDYALDTTEKTFTFSRATKTTQGDYYQVLFDKFKPNTQYTLIISAERVATSGNNASIIFRYTDGTTSTASNITSSEKSIILRTSLKNKSLQDVLVSWSGVAVSKVYYDESGLFEGVLTAGDCKPYNGNTYTITFGQTVYSAILDVLNGKLIITHEIGDLSDLSWQYRDTYEIFYSGVNRDVKIGTPNCACSGYLFNPDAISTSVSSISRELNDKEITTFENENNQGRFAIKDTNYTDVASFREAITGMKLVYELAQPIEIQLTPTQITTLIGENVIFADVADVTECKFTRK